MEQFEEILACASARIASSFVELEIHGGAPIYRERVYCYELYHQMRNMWPNPCEFHLNGEVDKSGHPIFAFLRLARCKPDLLVHGPGDMNKNYAAIEVKHARTSKRDLLKDFRTLTALLEFAGYRRAICFIYGVRNEQLEDSLRRRIARIRQENVDIRLDIEVWFHYEPLARAECVSILENF